MGKYGAGSPFWNRVKEMMIHEIAGMPGDLGYSGLAEEYPVDLKSFSEMDLMRSNSINDLPPDWKRFAEACQKKMEE